MANKVGPAKFRKGQWVGWSDDDGEGNVKPHVGKVESSTVHDDVRVYMIAEQDSTGTDGIRLMIVLEEELSPLKQH